MNERVQSNGLSRSSWGRSLVQVLPQYALIRGAFFLMIICARKLIPERVGNPHKDYVAFPGDDAWNLFLDSFCRWDSSWYFRIVDHGYRQTGGQSNVAFFPGFPYAARALNAVLGGDGWLAGLIVNNVAFLAGLVVLHRWITIERGDVLAKRATLFALVFPTTIFFSAYYSEAIFFFVVTCALFSFSQKQYVLATVFAAFACFTRSTGIFLAPAFAFGLLAQARFNPRTLGVAGFLRIAMFGLSALGFVGVMFLLDQQVGDPLAFIKEQAKWGRGSGAFPLVPIWTNLTTHHGDFMEYFEGVGALFLVVMTFASVRYGRPEETAFLALTTFFPLSTGTTMSMLRFALTSVPIYSLLARFFSTPDRERAWVVFSSMMAVLVALRYALWYWAG